ncbi:hypothetical protein AB0H69_34255 [Streptomyces phaeochromogenes]
MREPLSKAFCQDLSAVHGQRNRPLAREPRDRSLVRGQRTRPFVRESRG